MCTHFFSAATGTGSEIASAPAFSSDLQLQWLHHTPLPLTIALPAPCPLDNADICAPKTLCAIHTFLPWIKSKRKPWEPSHVLLSKAECPPMEMLSHRGAHVQIHLAPVTACTSQIRNFGFAQFCQGAWFYKVAHKLMLQMGIWRAYHEGLGA